MSGTVPIQYLRSVLLSGSLRELGAAGSTASTATRTDYPNLGTGIRQITPEAITSATATIPAGGAAPRNIGWRQPAVIQNAGATANPADPVAYPATTWPVVLRVASDTALVTAAITVIAYVTGVEVGRATSSAATLPTAAGNISIDVPISAFTSVADPRIQFEAYCNVTLGGTNLNGVKITWHTGGTSSSINPAGTFAVRAARAATDAVAAIVDSARRTLATVRRPSESVATVDSPRRVVAYARPVSDSQPSQVDSPRRVMTYVRLPGEVVAAMVDTAARVATYVRRPAEALAAMVDTTVRVIVARRTTSDSVPPPTDTASRIATFPRQTTDVVASPLDTSIRRAIFARAATDVVATPVDSATRSIVLRRIASETVPAPLESSIKLVTYGRTVRYQFQPGDEPLIDVTKSITGIVRTTDGAVYTAGALVVLYRSDTNVGVRTTTSGADGRYTFPRNSYDTAQYYVAAFITSPAAQQSVSERTLLAT